MVRGQVAFFSCSGCGSSGGLAGHGRMVGEVAAAAAAAAAQTLQVSPRTLQVVLGLTDIHPVAAKCECKQTAICCNVGKHLLPNAGGPQLDAVKHARAAYVDASVNLVTEKCLGLLYKLLHRALVVDDEHTIL